MHATVSLIWSCLPAANVHNLQVYCNGGVKNYRNMFKTILSCSAPHWWLEHLSQWIYNISQIKNNVSHHWFPPAGSNWYSELVKVRGSERITEMHPNPVSSHALRPKKPVTNPITFIFMRIFCDLFRIYKSTGRLQFTFLEFWFHLVENISMTIS